MTIPVTAVMTLALALRSTFAVTTTVLVVTAGQLQSLVADEPGALWALTCYLIVAYSVAAHSSSEGVAALGGALIVGVQWLQEWQMHGDDYLFVAVVFGGAWLLGRLVRQWRARATTAELHQEELTRAAVVDERARIARELHDIVAHGVSVIAIQADAARAVLAIDPVRAAVPLATISASAREVLDELRQLLLVLRMTAADEQSPAAPLPSLAQVPDLVAGSAAAGLPVELRAPQPAVPIPAVAQLTAYRIVQECLTNVLRHAGRVPTVVTVEQRGDELMVAVRNEHGSPGRPAGGSGHGLIGIRERTALAGGTFAAGPTADQGFEVVVRLPLSPRPAEVPA